MLPQEVPFATLALLSLQTGDPVAQLSVPVWHGLGGVHAAPFAHELHVPSKQTWFVPHAVPFG